MYAAPAVLFLPSAADEAPPDETRPAIALDLVWRSHVKVKTQKAQSQSPFRRPSPLRRLPDSSEASCTAVCPTVGRTRTRRSERIAAVLRHGEP
jgi:hypothetical protein